MSEIISIIINAALASGLIGTFLHHKAKERKAKAEASNSEHTAESVAIYNLQMSLDKWRDISEERESELVNKNVLIDKLYHEKQTDREVNHGLILENSDLKLVLKSAQIKTCNIRGCVNRNPPNEFY